MLIGISKQCSHTVITMAKQLLAVQSALQKENEKMGITKTVAQERVRAHFDGVEFEDVNSNFKSKRVASALLKIGADFCAQK